MALSNKGKIIAVWVAVVGVVALSIAKMEARESSQSKAKAKQTPKDPLAGVYEHDALLPATVAEDVMLPVYLTLPPRWKPTPMVMVVDGTVNDSTQLAVLITDITPEKAQMAYEYLKGLVVNEGFDLSEPGTLDEAVKLAVDVIAPKVDWSQGLVPYAFNDPEALVWRGTQLLGELAYQSYWNKQAAPSA